MRLLFEGKVNTPIIQAPMAGGATTPQLVAAVSNAGGLGSLAAGYMQPEEIKKAIHDIRKLTERSFAINLFVPENPKVTQDQIEKARNRIQTSCVELNFQIPEIHPPYAPDFEAQTKVILQEKISIVSFTFGIPNRTWIQKLKEQNIKLMGTATSLLEAKKLEENQIDFIVAQGSEAGGHRGTFLGKAKKSLTPITSLLTQLRENIRIPIIAAGGIMTADNVRDMFLLGAAAVQMGTAFLCCAESGIHPLYKKLLLESKQDNTVLTNVFSGKLARGIANMFINRMQDHSKDILAYPIQHSLTSAMRREASKQNNLDFMSLWAGQSHFLCQSKSAAKIIEECFRE